MKVKQSIPKHLRYTIQQFNAQFPTNDACLEWLKAERWPSGLIPCAKCETDRKHHRVTGRPAYACDYCGSMVSPMAGSIFEKSSTALRTWFYAMYLMSATRCGISAKQIQRETGVTYKTAWRMFKQIRTLMSEDISLEGAAVEADEMYFGGKNKNKHLSKRKGFDGRSTDEKTPVFGMVQRGGCVVAMVTPDTKSKTVLPIIHERVLPASIVYTDDYPIYDKLGPAPWSQAPIQESPVQPDCAPMRRDAPLAMLEMSLPLAFSRPAPSISGALTHVSALCAFPAYFARACFFPFGPGHPQRHRAHLPARLHHR
jgi:transposase-like protein